MAGLPPRTPRKPRRRAGVWGGSPTLHLSPPNPGRGLTRPPRRPASGATPGRGAEMTEPVISVEELSRNYGEVVALKSVVRGDAGVVGLLGPNGAGKSTSSRS